MHIYPPWLRWATAAGTVVLIALAGSILMREIRAYDSNVYGNFLRTELWLIQTGELDEGLTDTQVDALIITLLGAAEVAYNEILAVNGNNFDALNNRGAVLAQLGNYEAAIADYNSVITFAPGNNSIFFANRAVAYQGWSAELAYENRQNEADQKFNLAIEDFGRAIEANPNDPNYYLWRGTAFHALGELDAALSSYDQALERGRVSDVFPDILTARGWALFQQADALNIEAAAATAAREDQVAAEKTAAAAEKYQAALDDFRQVGDLTPASSDAWLAIGYVHYARKEYRDAIGAWGEAILLDPDDPVALFSQSAGLWAQAINPFYCRDDAASAEQRASSISGLQAAIADIDKALVLEPENDFAYRTRAQMQFLLGSCEPEFVFHEQLELAIESYNQALTYAPREDLYWLFRARLEVSLAVEIFKRGAASEQEALDVLDQATHDIRQALDLDPENGTNQVWYDFIIHSGNGYLYLKRADMHYDSDNFELALEDYRFAAELIPAESGDATEAAFSRGRTALRLGLWDVADQWYATGIESARAGNHTSQLKTAIEKLEGLAEYVPELRLQSEQILRDLQDTRDQLS